MRIAIVANDTTGGVAPYVALGLGMRAAGHAVRMVVPSDAAGLLRGTGLDHALLTGGAHSALRDFSESSGGGALATMRFMAGELPKHLDVWTRETLAACEGCGMLTGGVGGMVVGLSVADKLRVPFVQAHLQPIGVPTPAYPGVMLGGLPGWLGGWTTRMSHLVSDVALWLPFRRAMRSARESVLGLTGRAVAAQGQPVLFGFSRQVVPMPHQSEMTGYWERDATADTLPDGLERFLAGGGPVVSIGFGSMIGRSPDAMTHLVLAAVRQAGVRAVLLTGLGGLTPVAFESGVFCADFVPHDWLFRRVTAAVHHGGAGTTGAALRAGIPSLVVPFTMDQPFWGARVAALGAGPKPISPRWLTQAALARALRRMVDDAALQDRATAVGTALRRENGVGQAVARYEQLMANTV